jgi:hypothetical protein
VSLVAADMFAAAFPLGEVQGKFPFTANGRRIVLTHDFAYVDVVDGRTINVLIPAEFDSDFNSTPRALWTWFPPWECPEAGLTHDYLYQHPGTLTRADVDRIHRRIMELKGERKAKRVAAWLGIRAGGWSPWGEYRRRESPGTAA